MKTKWRPFLLLGLALLLITSVVGCTQSSTEAALDAAFKTGQAVGQAVGHAEGHADGYDAGSHAGYKVGYGEGKTAGLAELELAKQEASRVGYDKGYEDGYKDGLGHTADAPPSITPPKEITTPPPTLPDESQVIEDLAYIKIYLVATYSDDADPQAEGISLRITFYDSKSESISFQDVPVKVTVRLYGYRDFFVFPKEENRELVYKEQVTIYSSDGFFGTRIKIPFDDIGAKPNKYDEFGTMEVTVRTPNQGKFGDTWGFVTLYAEE